MAHQGLEHHQQGLLPFLQQLLELPCLAQLFFQIGFHLPIPLLPGPVQIFLVQDEFPSPGIVDGDFQSFPGIFHPGVLPLVHHRSGSGKPGPRLGIQYTDPGLGGQDFLLGTAEFPGQGRDLVPGQKVQPLPDDSPGQICLFPLVFQLEQQTLGQVPGPDSRRFQLLDLLQHLENPVFRHPKGPGRFFHTFRPPAPAVQGPGHITGQAPIHPGKPQTAQLLFHHLLQSLFLPPSIGHRIRQRFILLIPGPFPPVYLLSRFLPGRPLCFTGKFQEGIGFHRLPDVLFQFQGPQLEQFHLLDQMEVQLLLLLGSQDKFCHTHNRSFSSFLPVFSSCL